MKCPECGSTNTTRFQWIIRYDGLEYWICWDCERFFNVEEGIKGGDASEKI